MTAHRRIVAPYVAAGLAAMARNRIADQGLSMRFIEQQAKNTLAFLVFDNPGNWHKKKLKIWLHRTPWLLLAVSWAEDKLAPRLVDYPRDDGAPADNDLAGVAHWNVVGDMFDGGLPRWVAFAEWSLQHLYPEWRERFGKAHPCEARVAWLLTEMRAATAPRLVAPPAAEPVAEPLAAEPAPGPLPEPMPEPVTPAADSAAPAARRTSPAPSVPSARRVPTQTTAAAPRRAQQHTRSPTMGKPPAASGTLRLHGRAYKTVALRVQEFRAAHPIADGWAIVTRLEHADAERVLFRAAITDPSAREVAVGYAEEKREARGVNSTSALENCETSAIGRALAAAGFAGTEYASADELAGALKEQAAGGGAGQQSRNHHPSWTRDHKRFTAELQARGLTYDAVAAFCVAQHWSRPAGWGTDERKRFIADLDAGKLPALHKPVPPEEREVFVPDEGSGAA